ncbi:DUF4129 domain-containing protein [Agromyces tardus]|uniref:DUF4129 domain-containing protein n=1 Tax=Agromyces tardus TaxID=2583849 RepID=UPI001BAF9C98|nr:DUF4129 domain-containing protein [Agromyces tardus]
MDLSLLSRFQPPLDPDAPEARRWVLDELAKPEYRAAEPTAFDLAAQAVRDWIASLFDGATGLPGGVLALIVVVVVVVLVVVGLLVFGVPRLRRRATATLPLFDDGDLRDAATLRSAAEAAAASDDWTLAVEERFRALVRGLVERELVAVHPGTTAHGLADAAAQPFPDRATELAAAAADFDEVRYLAHAGTESAYRRMTELDRALAAARPAGDEADAALPAPVAGADR